MALQSTTLSYFQELETLKELEIDQNKAFLDLLVYAILADEEITDEELVQLDEELTRLPFLWDADARDAVVDHSADTREWLQENITDEDAMEKFLGALATRIDDEGQRLVGLRMFTAVLLADGLDDREEERLRGLGEVFGFADSAIDEIIEDVQRSLDSAEADED